MKSILERAEIGKAVDRKCGWAYTLRTDDLTELLNQFHSSADMNASVISTSVTAFEAGFYAGISCAINRGFNKQNDPRKGVLKE